MAAGPFFPPYGEDTAATQAPARRRKADSTAIPRIKLLSWLGLESVVWSVIIGHLTKWVGNWTYFITWQVRYAVGYGKSLWTVLYLKDFWDRLAVHVQNGLPGEAAVLAGITAAVILYFILDTHLPERADRIWVALTALLAGAGLGLLIAAQARGWHVHWFGSQEAPQWWVTGRHYTRDVGISLFGTIGVLFLFAKPKYPADDQVTVHDYLAAIPKALGAALVPIAVLGVLASQLSWLTRHGLQVPAHYGVLASEVNGWIAAGTWITVVMGIAGGLVAKQFLRRIADDVQWFFAARSAATIRDDTGLNRLRKHVIGTPAHRKRVHWLLDNRPVLPERSPWLVRGLLAAGFLAVLYAGAGAWLTLAGPAAVH